MQQFLIILYGTPASGKTKIAIHLRDFVHNNSIWLINKPNKLFVKKDRFGKTKIPANRCIFDDHLDLDQDYLDSALQDGKLVIITTKDKLNLFEIYKSSPAYEFQAVYRITWILDLTKLKFCADVWCEMVQHKILITS